MLADLDKVTFTININKKLYRIRVTKDIKKNTFKGMIISFANKISYTNKVTSMRYEKYPINSNLLEKITFISSACILLNNKDGSIELRNKMLKYVFEKYGINNMDDNIYNNIIDLNKYFSPKIFNRNRKKSFPTAIKYVNYSYLFNYYKAYLEKNTKLKSIIYLNEEKEGDNIKVKLTIGS
jgi:hypothetical protein